MAEEDDSSHASTGPVPTTRDISDAIRRYVVQVRDGCGDVEQCTTPTCFTYRQRTSSVPVRQYNTLAATSIAFAFASSTPLSQSFCPLVKHKYPLPKWEQAAGDKIDHKSLVQRLHTTKAFRKFLDLTALPEGDEAPEELLPDAIDRGYGRQTSNVPGPSTEEVTARILASGPSSTKPIAETLPHIDAPITPPNCVVADNLFISTSDFQEIIRVVGSYTEAGNCVDFFKVVEYVKRIFSNPRRLGQSFDECFSRDVASRRKCYSDVALLEAQLHTYVVFLGPVFFQYVRYALLEAIETDVPVRLTVRVMAIALHMLRYGGQEGRDMGIVAQHSPHTGLFDEHFPHVLVEDMALELSNMFTLHLVTLAEEVDRSPERSIVAAGLSDLIEAIMGFDTFYTKRLLRPWQVMMQATFLREWNGKDEVRIQSTVGHALEGLEVLHEANYFGAADWLHRSGYRMRQVYRHLDVEKTCLNWLATRPTKGFRHILSYHAIFDHHDHIEFFRTCCYLRMRRSYNQAEFENMSREKVVGLLKGRDLTYLNRRMRLDMRYYLVLQISRENILADAFNQLWQREQRELFRPLRIELLKDDGEMGHDYGGVQVEIFNLLCNEVCGPDNSIFEVNPQTQFAWFRPGSLEPLYRYELIGVLFGLAIFNGITLPLSLPLAFYVKLMGKTAGERYLEDGWPDLVKGFKQMRAYRGDIQSDLALEHVYTMNANGVSLDIDMENPQWAHTTVNGMVKHHIGANVLHVRTESYQAKDGEDSAQYPADTTQSSLASEVDASTFSWPGWEFTSAEPSTTATPVTSANLEAYITSLTQWTLDWSIRPQFFAFARGFYRVIDPRSLGVLTPRSFQTLFEGTTHIRASAVQSAATYQGYAPTDPQIIWFWNIVESYDQGMLQRLLEFVTACRRMPGGKASRLTFVIAKQFDDHVRGEGKPAALPRSSTCFGQLNLPEYESEAVMRERLGVALEHSVGFGQV